MRKLMLSPVLLAVVIASPAHSQTLPTPSDTSGAGTEGVMGSLSKNLANNMLSQAVPGVTATLHPSSMNLAGAAPWAETTTSFTQIHGKSTKTTAVKFSPGGAKGVVAGLVTNVGLSSGLNVQSDDHVLNAAISATSSLVGQVVSNWHAGVALAKGAWTASGLGAAQAVTATVIQEKLKNQPTLVKAAASGTGVSLVTGAVTLVTGGAAALSPAGPAIILAGVCTAASCAISDRLSGSGKPPAGPTTWVRLPDATPEELEEIKAANRPTTWEVLPDATPEELEELKEANRPSGGSPEQPSDSTPKPPSGVAEVSPEVEDFIEQLVTPAEPVQPAAEKSSPGSSTSVAEVPSEVGGLIEQLVTPSEPEQPAARKPRPPISTGLEPGYGPGGQCFKDTMNNDIILCPQGVANPAPADAAVGQVPGTPLGPGTPAPIEPQQTTPIPPVAALPPNVPPQPQPPVTPETSPAVTPTPAQQPAVTPAAGQPAAAPPTEVMTLCYKSKSLEGNPVVCSEGGPYCADGSSVSKWSSARSADEQCKDKGGIWISATQQQLCSEPPPEKNFGPEFCGPTECRPPGGSERSWQCTPLLPDGHQTAAAPAPAAMFAITKPALLPPVALSDPEETAPGEDLSEPEETAHGGPALLPPVELTPSPETSSKAKPPSKAATKPKPPGASKRVAKTPKARRRHTAKRTKPRGRSYDPAAAAAAAAAIGAIIGAATAGKSGRRGHGH